jgi:DNA-binding NarL/FixJ family response regulator
LLEGERVPIRILLADDHASMREGLRVVLASDAELDVLAQEADGAAALAGALRLRPDVAVLDVEMPELSGIEVARKLAAARSPPRVVRLARHRDESFVAAAIDAGVSGYVVKEDAARELVQAVRAAVRGDVYLSPRVAGAVLKAARGGARPEDRARLTPRERDVLRLLANGLTSKEIASALSVSAKTVDGHRASIMDKIGIRSIAGLTKYAIRNHLSRLDE